MSEDGARVLRNACFYLFERYGGPFNMQRDAGQAVEIMFNLLIKGKW